MTMFPDRQRKVLTILAACSLLALRDLLARHMPAATDVVDLEADTRHNLPDGLVPQASQGPTGTSGTVKQPASVPPPAGNNLVP